MVVVVVVVLEESEKVGKIFDFLGRSTGLASTLRSTLKRSMESRTMAEDRGTGKMGLLSTTCTPDESSIDIDDHAERDELLCSIASKDVL